MRRVCLAVGGLLLLAVTGCSNDAPSAQSTPTATQAATTTASSAAPTEESSTARNAESTPPGSIVPAYGCLKGRYKLARFVAVGHSATYGTGQGGDVTVTFSGSKYQLQGAGKKPITVTLAGTKASLVIDGTISGTFSGKENKAAFTVGKTSGTGTLSSGGQRRTISMKQVANVLSPAGTATLACTNSLLTVIFEDERLEFQH